MKKKLTVTQFLLGDNIGSLADYLLAEKVGIVETVRITPDGQVIPNKKKQAPAGKPKAVHKTKRRAARKPKAKKPVAVKAIRPPVMSQSFPRITPKMPRLR